MTGEDGVSVRIEEHVWISLSDGCRLGARLWLPEDALQTPVPAILEYIPYRKRDGTRGRDNPMQGYYAQHGYAAIRVDMRGSAESDGHLADEYLKLEQDDALEVIAWIAAQPWCNGDVGMQGKSWSGFNALQVAARRPPALKAIITTFSTDNRYTDDIHFMGGCVLNDNLWWGGIMLAYQARPLDPEIVGEDWRARWLERLDTLPFFPALWLEHQRYDDYWRHGSVCTDFDAIVCPVLAIGGWVDSYTNAVPRLLEGLKVPRRGIIGPWGHIYPHDGVPGPAIGYLQEAVRWWDHWLKGRDTGVMNEPLLRAYLQDPVPPDGTRTYTPGRWVGLDAYPSADIVPTSLRLQPGGGLADAAATQQDLSIRSPQSHGRAGGEWMGTGCPGEHPTDQRLDDGGALVFETDVLEHDIAVLGAPRLTLDIAADAPVAHLVARLSDVLPDGRVARVSYQVLNLTHRDGHDAPTPLEPGRFYSVAVDLNLCGHRFMAGHRIRLSIASAYWPLIWPAPSAATLTVRTGESVLSLPTLTSPGIEITFPPPAHGPLTPITTLDPGLIRRYSQQDHVTGEHTYVTEAVGGVFGEGVLRFDEIGTEVAHSLKRELTIKDDDPLSARYVLTQTFEMGRDGWRTRIDVELTMRSDRDTFYLTGVLNAFEGEAHVMTKTWEQAIARDLV
jgi:putative CocE/NonD family hydrolase